MAEYVLRIMREALQNQNPAIDDLINNISSHNDITLLDSSLKMARVEFNGCMQDLYDSLGYTTEQILIADPAPYKLV